MQIRPLVHSDRASVIRLWESAGLVRPWNPPEADFDRALAGPTSTVLGGFDGGEMVATVMVGHDGHRGWVYDLAVAVDRRGTGLGSEMMEGAEAWLKEQGAVKIQLMVRHTNAAVVEFYEGLGYQDAEVTVMAKWL